MLAVVKLPGLQRDLQCHCILGRRPSSNVCTIIARSFPLVGRGIERAIMRSWMPCWQCVYAPVLRILHRPHRPVGRPFSSGRMASSAATEMRWSPEAFRLSAALALKMRMVWDIRLVKADRLRAPQDMQAMPLGVPAVYCDRLIRWERDRRSPTDVKGSLALMTAASQYYTLYGTGFALHSARPKPSR
jgi:hypothetical protein